MVGDRPAEQAQGLLAGLAALELGELRRAVPDDGARTRRGVASQVVGDDQPGHAPPAHVDLDLVVLEHAAVEVGQGDRTQLVVLGLGGTEAFALDAPVGDGRSARHPAEGLAGGEAVVGLGVHRGALTGDAAAGQGQRPREVRQVLEQRPVALQDARVGALLRLQRVAPDELALARREADREGRERAAEDGDLAPQRVGAQLVAVERQAGLEPEGVAGAEPDGNGARAGQGVPEGRPVVRGREQFEGDGLAGIAGPRDARRGELAAAQPQGRQAELVAQRLRQGARLDQAAEDLARRLALEGKHGDLAGLVGHLDVGEAGEVLVEVVPVPVAVRGVDDEEVLALGEAVEVGVVHGAAGLGGHHRVLRLQQVERLGVVL